MNYTTNTGLPERIALKVCYTLFAERHYNAIAATVRRRAFIRNLETKAENGKIALIESGIDCDGVQYNGVVHIIDANREEVEALVSRITEWADGPFSVQLEKPSVAQHVEHISRDLVMEAFEDGHQHIIYA